MKRVTLMAKVDPKICRGCKICEKVCPVYAIKVTDKKAYPIRVYAPLALTVTNDLPCAFSEEPFSGYPFSHAQKEQPPQE